MRYAWIPVVIVAAILLWWTRAREPAAVDTEPGSSSSATPSSSSAPGRTGLTRLATAADRQRVADRIAAARAAQRMASSAPPRPSLPDPTAEGDLARASVPLRDALGEAIPLLAKCYSPAERRDGHARARMTLAGDDRGTLIDADDLADEEGRPLPAALAECLKTTLQSLELPPLAEGGDLHIEYSFVFH